MSNVLVSSIAERYRQVLSRITTVALSVGRSPESVRLVVVSKSQPLEVIRAAIDAGITVFGENYPEEAVEKMKSLGEPAVEWHMIGHVQSRKAALVAAHFTILHSLDSLRLAGRLDRFCDELNRVLPVLLEFNVSGEESKFGFSAWDESHWQNLLLEISQILNFSHIRVCGLMTMPPYNENQELVRPFFQRLHHLQDYLKKNFSETSWSELSMGTSVDYETAIQEGATMVRIGQAILGPRIG
jgi:pyridoxal phosphate enzyme (YggS family)